MKNKFQISIYLIFIAICLPVFSIGKMDKYPEFSQETTSQWSFKSVKKKITKVKNKLFQDPPKVNKKKYRRSLYLFGLSLFCLFIAAGAGGGMALVMIVLGGLFNIMGMFLGLSDNRKHRSRIGFVGFCLNALLCILIFAPIIIGTSYLALFALFGF